MRIGKNQIYIHVRKHQPFWGRTTYYNVPAGFCFGYIEIVWYSPRIEEICQRKTIMLHKKDYGALAKIIKKARENNNNCWRCGIPGCVLLDNIQEAIAKFCQKQNPHFDKTLFDIACRIDDID